MKAVKVNNKLYHIFVGDGWKQCFKAIRTQNGAWAILPYSPRLKVTADVRNFVYSLKG